MTEVILPKMGMQTADVDIVAVHVSVGDRVSIGDEMFEIESEKAQTIVEAPVSGIVSEVLVAEGDIREPGAVLARIQGV
jgi:pyruvate/2-oxoglutarate dehydrogenase complex dihydrolipoamide acyltransferase (E2) component